jgi:lipoprotein-releasing system permease protein
MFGFLPRFIGLRYSGARQRNQLVSFISGVSILGLCLGVGLLLTVLSVMNGFDRELREKILGVMPHGAIYHRYGIDDWHTLSSKLMTDENIIATAPFVELKTMISFRAKATPALLYGIDIEQESKVSIINNFIPASSLEQLSSNKSILIGSGIAKKLNVNVGDHIQLLIPSKINSQNTPKFKSFLVAGLITSKTEIDHSLMIINLAAASQLSDHPTKVSGIRIKSNNLFSVTDSLHKVVQDLPYGYYYSDWTRTHGNLFHAIQMSKNMVGLLLFLIIAIAAFNVISTLVMVVIDKRSEIAILKTLGATRRDIISIFMVQGTFIGCIGIFLGVLLGVAGSLSIKSLISWIELFFNIQFLNSDVYPVSYIPSEMWIGDFIGVALAAFVLTLLATIYPAWMAGKVEPAVALQEDI